VHGGHDVARSVRADGDEAEGERAAVAADVGERGAVRETGVGGVVVGRELEGERDGAVARVTSEVDGDWLGGGRSGAGRGMGEGAGADGPGRPERVAAVEGRAGAGVLAGEGGDAGGDGGRGGGGFGGWSGCSGVAGSGGNAGAFGFGPFGGGGAGCGSEGEVDFIPPVELSAVLYADSGEPFLVAERDKEMAGRVPFCDLGDGWVREVVIVVVAYNNSVNKGDVLDLTRHLGVPFGAEPAERGAAILEDGIEKHAETRWEFDIVAGVAEPGGSEFGVGRIARLEEDRSLYRHGRWCGVRYVSGAAPSSPDQGFDYLWHRHRLP